MPHTIAPCTAVSLRTDRAGATGDERANLPASAAC
jgi:hypothetical protein